MRRNRAHIAGFTLAEVLVATTLISLVMASVYALFGSSLRTWRSAEDKFDNFQNARLAMGIMRRELDNMLPAAGYLFNGDRHEIEFITIAEPFDVEEAQGRHMMRVRYRFNRTGGEIEREEALVEVALPKPKPGEEEDSPASRVKVKNREDFIIATNVERFDIRYIWVPVDPERDQKKPPKREKPIRTTRHEEGWGLPRGIEISMVFYDPENEADREKFTLRRFINNPGARYTREKLMEMIGGDGE